MVSLDASWQGVEAFRFQVVPFFLEVRSMRKAMTIVKRFFVDEKAAEVTELGIVLALVVAGAVGILALIGPVIRQAYQDTSDALSNS